MFHSRITHLIIFRHFLGLGTLVRRFIDQMVPIVLQILSAVAMVGAVTSSSSSSSSDPTTTARSAGGHTASTTTTAAHAPGPTGVMINVTCNVYGAFIPVLHVAVPSIAVVNLPWSCPGLDHRKTISGTGTIGDLEPAMFVDRKLPSARLSPNKVAVTGKMRAYQNFVGKRTVGFYMDQDNIRYKVLMTFDINKNLSAGNLTLFGPERDIFRVRRGEDVTVNLTVEGSGNNSYPSLVCFVSSVTENGKTTVNRDLGNCSDLVDFNGVNSENYDRMQVNVTFKAKKDTAMEAAHLCFAAGDRNWVSRLDYNMGNGTYHGNVRKGVQCLNYIVEAAAPTAAPASFSAPAYGFINALVFGAILTMLSQ
ncbi:hypothetical protein FOZ61_003071 [Perkinsus olseni]|uniref:Uncharacterized protein n=1 Tax=Perkinsus olseni TaxID=32597 RepID=A0A7J6LQY5_PEROL|nr:hypothetical protein FOZ61_003071 [Perkinsus olseni]